MKADFQGESELGKSAKELLFSLGGSPNGNGLQNYIRASEAADLEKSSMSHETHPTREEVNAKLEAVESRIEAKFSQIESKLDRLPKFWPLFGSISGVVFTGVTIIITVIAFGGDRFDAGLSASGLTLQSRENAKQIEQMLEADKMRDAKLDRILQRLEAGQGE